MPREEKKIIFSFSETYKAVYSLCSKKALQVPPTGEIASVEHDKTKALVFLQIKEAGSDKLSKIEYKEDFLAAALLLFCMGCGIPISKRAKKSVFVENGEVVLFAEQ